MPTKVKKSEVKFYTFGVLLLVYLNKNYKLKNYLLNKMDYIDLLNAFQKELENEDKKHSLEQELLRIQGDNDYEC